ncbi:tRNA wybutosine-synthesizing protein 3 [Methanophagales archaeon]|nr:tRNA wybutosine-synthesizing protein 3 [Methanophagales archaeon]
MMTIYEEQKKKALERLRIMGADEEVVGILEALNRLDDFYTTSSCSGRVALICIPEIGAKRDAEFIGKWHRAVTKEEVSEAIKAPEKGELWLISQSPILHVSCRGLEKAKALLRVAIESGFKYSGIKSISKDNGKIMVEIMSTERMDVPLGKDDVFFCSESYMDYIVSKANFMLTRGKVKLKRLYYGLQELE